ncbi:hypothetical protein SARC_03654 [Sphaeroforma arctica JP610]|uniref:Small acidic protein-like domain-containing protein n=1 Tax=Sphaeroforma arctica JP610 TaxID=667725 RepID=A0A0L0G512_9EUKA|nr:hypothetical protein SARC_03654 [Sphaeroforma arctica JP610]KNC84110.1 hypothetical protein SARC_03654 [Sphaeroforma arctica JP610]|eukprot:XP_014158012.1 hypothetical protein SARC_03654 [Sphaeroforma arctica JP610]
MCSTTNSSTESPKMRLTQLLICGAKLDETKDIKETSHDTKPTDDTRRAERRRERKNRWEDGPPTDATANATAQTDPVKKAAEEAIKKATAMALAAKSNIGTSGVNNPTYTESKEVVQKRKLIWGNKKVHTGKYLQFDPKGTTICCQIGEDEKVAKTDTTYNEWEKTGFEGEDGDHKRQKFLKLMGMGKRAQRVPEGDSAEKEASAITAKPPSGVADNTAKALDGTEKAESSSTDSAKKAADEPAAPKALSGGLCVVRMCTRCAVLVVGVYLVLGAAE